VTSYRGEMPKALRVAQRAGVIFPPGPGSLAAVDRIERHTSGAADPQSCFAPGNVKKRRLTTIVKGPVARRSHSRYARRAGCDHLDQARGRDQPDNRVSARPPRIQTAQVGQYPDGATRGTDRGCAGRAVSYVGALSTTRGVSRRHPCAGQGRCVRVLRHSTLWYRAAVRDAMCPVPADQIALPVPRVSAAISCRTGRRGAV
jgi:hypothetical protein